MKLSPTIQKLLDQAERAERAARAPKKKRAKKTTKKRAKKTTKKRAKKRATKRKATKKRTKKRTTKKRSRARSSGPATNGARDYSPGVAGLREHAADARARFGSPRRKAARSRTLSRADAAEQDARADLLDLEDAGDNAALRAARARYDKALSYQDRAIDMQRGLGPRGFVRVR